MQRTLPVKQVSVSASVEIYCDEIPTFSSVDTSSTCKKCQQERIKTQNYKPNNHYNNKKGKRKQNRANTPIVIQLRDTIKAAIKQKQRGKRNVLVKQESSDAKEDIEVDTDNSSDRSDVPLYKKNYRRKNSKNFNSAFINAVEKKHRRNYPPYNVHSSYGFENPFNEKFVAEYVLNNVCETQITPKFSHKKNIVECDNVELICNDLNSVESVPDDTEESDILSTTSSSEIQSDSDVSVPQDVRDTVAEPPSSGLAPDMLQQLAVYTTGCPLLRYDCPPDNCPQCQWQAQPSWDCQAWGYPPAQPQHQHQPHTKSSQNRSTRRNKSKKFAQHNPTVPSKHRETATVELDNISSTTESENDVNEITDSISETSDASHCDSLSPVSKTKNFTWRDRHTKKSHRSNTFKHKTSHLYTNNTTTNDFILDTVLIDLTDTDITFSVYYHHSISGSPNDPISLSSGYGSQPSSGYGSQRFPATLAPGSGHAGDLYSCYSVPYYQQYMYWSSYYTPMYTMPMPFCLEAEDSLPKTAMVPPDYLHTCEYLIHQTQSASSVLY